MVIAGDLNPLKELVQGLDYQNPNPNRIEAIGEIVVELNATAYDEVAYGDPSAPVYDTGAPDRIHSLIARLKMDIETWERQSIIDAILKLLE